MNVPCVQSIFVSAVIRIFPTENELTVEEDEGHVSICVNMVGLTERPVNISIVTVDDTAIG